MNIVHIQPFHLDKLVKIERTCYSAKKAWKKQNFMEVFSKSSNSGYTLLDNEIPIAYLIVSFGAVRCLEIMNLVVHPDEQRKGYGTKLIEFAKEKTLQTNRSLIQMCVSEYSLGAHLFLKKQKFKAVDIFKNFYDDFDEDAYLFEHKVRKSRVKK